MYLYNYHFYSSKNHHYSKPTKFLQVSEVDYRFHFNGQEKDDEVSGAGNTMSAEYWEYDSRLGRRWNIDPKPDISLSSYACFRNNPIGYFDVKGDTIGINLFAKTDPNYKDAQTLLGKLDGKKDGVFIIACHGNSGGMQIGKSMDGKTVDKKIYNADELIKEFRAACPDLDDAFNEGKKITLTLYSCNVGNTKNDPVPIAQDIANTSENLTVNAPNAYCRTGKLNYYLNRHDDDVIQELKFNTFKKDKSNPNSSGNPNWRPYIKPSIKPIKKGS